MLTGILQSWSSRRPDPLLRPFLRAPDERAAGRALDTLLTQHVQPLLQKIIGQKFGVYFDRHGDVRQETTRALDVQDLLHKAQSALIESLWKQREKVGVEPIAELKKYTAMTAHRTCTNWFRENKPKWAQLKAALRYLLEHQSGFAEWKTWDGTAIAGFSAWQPRQTNAPSSKRLTALLLDPAEALREVLPLDRIQSKPTADVLEVLFNHLGHPLETDQLVNVCAALYQTKEVEVTTGTTNQEGDVIVEGIAATGPSPEDEVEIREYLRYLWKEIQSSPLKHRRALLFNLRDGSGRGILAFLIIRDIVTLDQIAATLEMSIGDLANVWNDLPWDDLQIGVTLGLTRQQVIDCRKNCRKRLEARAASYDQEKV